MKPPPSIWTHWSIKGGPKCKKKWYLLASKLIPFLLGIRTIKKKCRSLGAPEVLPLAPLFRQNIQRISKIYKGKIFAYVFSIFTPKIATLDKIGFRGCNHEVQTFLQTPISIAWINYGVYGNYGQNPNMTIMAIQPQLQQTPQLRQAIDIGSKESL